VCGGQLGDGHMCWWCSLCRCCLNSTRCCTRLRSKSVHMPPGFIITAPLDATAPAGQLRATLLLPSQQQCNASARTSNSNPPSPTCLSPHDPQVSAEPSDEAIRRTLDSLHAKAKGATSFIISSEPDTVRPMLDVVWAPVLGALSVLFDESQETRIPETFGAMPPKGGCLRAGCLVPDVVMCHACLLGDACLPDGCWLVPGVWVLLTGGQGVD
jgi:hypothetical protein